MNIPILTSFLFAGCLLGALSARGQASAGPELPGAWAGWTTHDAAAGEFSPGAGGVTFQRTAGGSDPYLSRTIPYGKHHFQLKIRYRTDGKLSPTVLIFLPPAVDIRPLVIIRLPASAEWKDFETDFVGHNTKDAVVEMRLYPGTAGAEVMKPGGLTPAGNQAGRAEFASVSWTQTPQPVADLTKGPVPFKTEQIVFKRVGDLEMKVHIDRPATVRADLPAVIWFHGGGFVGGTPDNCLLQTTYLASRGIICVRPQYRLVNQGGNADLTLEDAADAVAWVKEHAREYGIDPRRFVIAGTSAGAVLGSVLAHRTPGCIGFIGLCGSYDVVKPGDSAALDPHSAYFLFGRDPGMWRRASAIYQIRPQPVPAFLIHGLRDSTLDYRQSTRYAEALRAAGGRAEVVVVPWLNHVPNLVADDVFQQIEMFLRGLPPATGESSGR